MLLEMIAAGLGIDSHESADEIKVLLAALPEDELKVLAADVMSLDDDAKDVIVAALEFLIGQDGFGRDEVSDIVFAAFAAAPVAVDSGCFSDDTTDAVEFMMDCIIEGERNIRVLRTHALSVLNGH